MYFIKINDGCQSTGKAMGIRQEKRGGDISD
jgi:hypothetical protein